MLSLRGFKLESKASASETPCWSKLQTPNTCKREAAADSTLAARTYAYTKTCLRSRAIMRVAEAAKTEYSCTKLEQRP